MAEAIKLLDAEIEQDNEHNRVLYNAFFKVLRQREVPYRLNGDPVNRINGNISVSIEGVSSIQLLAALYEYSISTGSACSTGKKSHVLEAISCPDNVISGTIRIGFGRFSEQDDIVAIANKIADYYENIR